ncbi:MAG TPA: imidazoleglycerol-phosphate dehydratase HisB [Candidatus Dormibacteraeota bacterium]|jgi:imidazoleglycerol-phosphate dehydratase|nr:imidazoleglycerol-phosphate dehydratase HisB [Candidatus Dormibacteraeota bacterium]
MKEAARRGHIVRKSKETQLDAAVKLDSGHAVSVSSGLPFLDHMLEQVARYGGFDLSLHGQGDVHVDAHHLVEDAGIVLGQALSKALGSRTGIVRYAHAYAPLDESLARVVVDLGKRPFLSYNLPLKGKVGTLESEVLEEFWRAFSIHVGATIHVDLIRGRNRHHIAESAFKALGLSLKEAMTMTGATGAPSSKGLLG